MCCKPLLILPTHTADTKHQVLCYNLVEYSALIRQLFSPVATALVHSEVVLFPSCGFPGIVALYYIEKRGC